MIVRQDPANMPKAKPVKVFVLILKEDLRGSPFNTYGQFLIGLPGHHLGSLKSAVIAENSLNCICS